MPAGPWQAVPPRSPGTGRGAPAPSSSCHYAMRVTKHSRQRTAAFPCSRFGRPRGTRHGSCRSSALRVENASPATMVSAAAARRRPRRRVRLAHGLPAPRAGTRHLRTPRRPHHHGLGVRARGRAAAGRGDVGAGEPAPRRPPRRTGVGARRGGEGSGRTADQGEPVDRGVRLAGAPLRERGGRADRDHAPGGRRVPRVPRLRRAFAPRDRHGDGGAWAARPGLPRRRARRAGNRPRSDDQGLGGRVALHRAARVASHSRCPHRHAGRAFRAHTASRRRRAGLRGAAGYPAVSGAGVGHGRAAAGGLGLSVRGARTRRRRPDVGTSRTDGPDGGTRHDPRGGEARREARGRRRSARPQAGRGARATRGVGSRGGGRRRELRYPSASARAAVLVQHALRHAHDRALQPGQDPLGLTRPKMGAHNLRHDA